MAEKKKTCFVNCLLFGGCSMEKIWCDIGITILRVYVGLSLAFAHGIKKIPPSEQFVGMVGEMGFPMPILFAWCAGLAEFMGGIFLALGLLTRPAAFFILCTMATAGFITHAEDPYKVKELAFVYGGIALMFLFVGSGRICVDRFLRSTKEPQTETQEESQQA